MRDERRHSERRDPAVAGSTAGRLLVATPTLLDPNFYRAVLLMLEHDANGALGVVLNRPLDHRVADHLPGWAPYLTEPGQIFLGGPVQSEMAVGVARRPDAATRDDWPSVLDGIGVVDVSADPATIDGIDRMRIFAGYAGWSAGQLEFEIAAGSWFVFDATPDDVFTDDPAGLWRRVVRRQPGRVALYADHPFDPSTN